MESSKLPKKGIGLGIESKLTRNRYYLTQDLTKDTPKIKKIKESLRPLLKKATEFIESVGSIDVSNIKLSNNIENNKYGDLDKDLYINSSKEIQRFVRRIVKLIEIGKFELVSNYYLNTTFVLPKQDVPMVAKKYSPEDMEIIVKILQPAIDQHEANLKEKWAKRYEKKSSSPEPKKTSSNYGSNHSSRISGNTSEGYSSSYAESSHVSSSRYTTDEFLGDVADYGGAAIDAAEIGMDVIEVADIIGGILSIFGD
jgi:hypothetical protein